MLPALWATECPRIPFLSTGCTVEDTTPEPGGYLTVGILLLFAYHLWTRRRSKQGSKGAE